MTITSKDLSGGNALTGVARKQAQEAEKQARLQEKMLEEAIKRINEEKEKAIQKDLKKKKVPKKKK